MFTSGTPAARRGRWVLLHGTPMTPAVWEPLAAHLDDQGAATVLCPDTTPRADDRAPHHDVAQRVAGTLRSLDKAEQPGARRQSGLPASGSPPAIRAEESGWDVVGHSFGGQVAIELSITHPDLVRSLTVLCARHTPFPPFRQLAAAIRDGAPVDVEVALQRWFRPADRRRRPDVVAYARTCLTTANRSVYAQTLDAIAGFDRSNQIGAISVPVTAVGYTDDQVSGPDAMRSLADAVANADLVIRSGGHMGPFIDPAASAAVLRHTARRATQLESPTPPPSRAPR